MNICVIGTGYVGLITGTCLAQLGNSVMCVDVVQDKVDSVNSGESPFYEPKLPEMIRSNIEKKRLVATTELSKAVSASEVTFICVGTPPKDTGESDLTHIHAAAAEIGKVLERREGKHIIVVKSTVPPGTSESIIPIIEKESGKKNGDGFGVCMNPEFLREGNAVDDFMKPDRVVVGGERDGDIAKISSIYKPLNARIIRTDLRTAEMIKYASNSFLATKVSFINELGNICKLLGIDVYDVAEGMGLDNRISPHFL
ncbi:MAG: nucleotide sugar dehydrogenase, partial [Candidatus Micrarchaeota archaeon]